MRAQKDVGIDVPGDGEFGKSMGNRVNYGAWWSYAFQRLGGSISARPALTAAAPRRSRPGEIVLTSQDDRRDRQRFAAAYADPEFGRFDGAAADDGSGLRWAADLYRSAGGGRRHRQLQGGARRGWGSQEGFMTAVAPGTAYRIGNAYYQDDMEFLYDCAEAMREEYKAIVDAGLGPPAR